MTDHRVYFPFWENRLELHCTECDWEAGGSWQPDIDPNLNWETSTAHEVLTAALKIVEEHETAH